MGASARSIATKYGVHHSTVSNTLKHATTRDLHASAPHTGAPRKTTGRQDRQLVQDAVKSGPIGRRQPLKEINANVMPEVCRKTTVRRLHKANIKKWRAANRILLLPEHKVERLAWGRQYNGLTRLEWAAVCWSDEMSVCKQDGAVNTWVFRTGNDRFHPECVEPLDNRSRITVMFWGCFAGDDKGGLTTLFPDYKLIGKRGVTGKIILEVAYKEYLPDMLDDFPERVFMQDNACMYTIPETKAWFEEKGYTLMEWPRYSPDLNPIKMI